MLRVSPAFIWSDVPWLRVRLRLGLTAQQMVIVRHILERDLTTPAIARAMGISLSSVGTQLERVFRKLEVRSRTAMAVRVMTEVVVMMLEESSSEAGGAGRRGSSPRSFEGPSSARLNERTHSKPHGSST